MKTNVRHMTTRIVADILLMIAAFLLPWWIVLLFAVALSFMFNRFLELLLVAFLMDLLYAVPLQRFGGFEFILSLASIPLYFILSFIKSRMRF